MKQLSIIVFAVFCFPIYGQPDWEVNNALYNLDGSIVVSLTIEEELSEDTNDLVAAFDAEGNCRGVSSISYNAISETYIGYLTVVGTTYGEELTFKIYDASETTVYLTSNEPIVFVSNLDLGDLFEPYEVISSEKIELSIESLDSIHVKCYPNPVQDFLMIGSENQLDILSLTFYDKKGAIVKELFSEEKKIDMSDLIPGVYFLVIKSEKGIATKKIVKK